MNTNCSSKELSLYVGCALTGAPEHFRNTIETFKDLLRKEVPCRVFNFLGLVKGGPTDVYRVDIHECVGSADFFVAVCDHPAIGLGYEMGTAIEKRGIPALALTHVDSKVSRLVLGIDHPHYRFERYKNLLEDGVEIVVRRLRELNLIQDIVSEKKVA